MRRLDRKEKKDTSPKIQDHPVYFITGRSLQQLPPGNCKGKSLSKKGGGDDRHMKPRCSPLRGAGWGQGRCFLGHLTRVLFLKFPFPPLFVDPNCSHAHEMRPWTSSPPASGSGRALPNCLCPAFPPSLQGRRAHSHICFQNHLNRGQQRPADDICLAAC